MQHEINGKCSFQLSPIRFTVNTETHLPLAISIITDAVLTAIHIFFMEQYNMILVASTFQRKSYSK